MDWQANSRIFNMRNWRTNLLALTLFILLTLLMTYPIVSNMGSSVKDLGDPLLNTWIIAWNVHKLTSFDIQNYFNANIFFPHKRTLAYSEHLFPQSIIALPVLLVLKNPIFAYNFVLLFSFITSGFGMFLLAQYLTKSAFGGIIAGIIFAFSPFMFVHLGHQQVITAGGIPLSFLFLHKFFRYEKDKHLFLFTLFFLLQVLANGYYALYLSLFAGLYILLYIISRNKFKDWQFWTKMAIFSFIVLAVAGPFFRQYFLVRKEMGFVRELGYNADLTSFLATSPLSRIYGNLTVRFSQPEGGLFPGILAFSLAIIGIVHTIKKNKRMKPIVEKYAVIYSSICLLSFLFTFGSNGPYILLYKFVPGFNGLRVASRIHIFVMFSMAVLAAFGIKALFSYLHLRKRRIYLVFIPLSILMLIEYLSIPVPLKTMPVKEDVPEVYKWLAKKEGCFSMVELPFPKLQDNAAWIECSRLYYSTYHWKKLVNGYSGYFPPLYNELRRRWQTQPLEPNINDLKSLGVEYIVLHSSLYEPQELKVILTNIPKLEGQVHLIKQLGEAYVYELISFPGDYDKEILRFKSRPIPKTSWTVDSNVNRGNVQYTIDGDISTRWHIGGRNFDVLFAIDLSHPYIIRGLSMKSGANSLHYPQSYRIELSANSLEWTIVADKEKVLLPIRALLKPKDLSLDITFPPTKARYIRFINTEKKIEKRWWSIYEIEIFENIS